MLKSVRHAVVLGAVMFATGSASQAAEFELGMVIKSTTNPYYNATLKGAQIGAAEIGGKVGNWGPTESTATGQIDIINSLANRHISAIAVAPNDAAAVVPSMKRASQLGAVVITFDADSDPAARKVYVNSATTDAIGGYGATHLAKDMGMKGEIAIVSAQPTSANQNAWIKAFRAELSKPEYSGIKIVDEVYGYDDEQKAFDATVALTTKYPNLAGIFAPTCPGAPAVGHALETVKKNGTVKVAGTCVPSISAQYMLDGTINTLYLWDPIKLGYVTYYVAKYMSEGKLKGQPGESFTIEKGAFPGTYSIGANGEVITTDPLQYTKDNYQQNQY
jgi:rhamnose transport system substrate-binding protein